MVDYTFFLNRGVVHVLSTSWFTSLHLKMLTAKIPFALGTADFAKSIIVTSSTLSFELLDLQITIHLLKYTQIIYCNKAIH